MERIALLEMSKMTARLLLRLLATIVFMVLLGASASPTSAAEPQTATPLQQVVAPMAMLEWDAIERRVRRGVSRAVSSFRFGVAEREDVIAAAMERAWSVFSATKEPIRSPEAWGCKIAERISLDTLRREKRDRLQRALPLNADAVVPGEALECFAGPEAGPDEQLAAAERCALLDERIRRWPKAEQRLARLLLEGHAETITAAAWLYRVEEETRGEEGTMYPQKARTLLESRRRELEDLL